MVSYRGEANVTSQLFKNWESQRCKENERKENWRTDIAERLTCCHMIPSSCLPILVLLFHKCLNIWDLCQTFLRKAQRLRQEVAEITQYLKATMRFALDTKE